MAVSRHIIVLGAALVLGACESTPEQSSDEVALSATIAEIANTAEKGRDYASAAGHYKQLLAREPENRQALLGLARNLRYAGVPKDAIKELRPALRTSGEQADLLLELGKAQLASSLINDAQETLIKAVAANPEHWEPHATLAIIQDRVGKYPTAQDNYRKALKLSPGNIAVQNNYALSLTLAGKLEQAVPILKKIADSENATPQTRQNLALLYALRGDLKTARGLLLQDLPPEAAEKNLAAYRKLRGRVGGTAATGNAGSALAKPAPPPAPKLALTGTRLLDEAVPHLVLKNSNVRRGPSTKFPPVAFVPKGAEVKLTGISKNRRWFLVTLRNGKRGYVFHKLLSPRIDKSAATAN